MRGIEEEKEVEKDERRVRELCIARAYRALRKGFQGVEVCWWGTNAREERERVREREREREEN